MAPDSGFIPVVPDLGDQGPVDAGEFNRLMGEVGSPETLAIAVSGGCDSMALCLLAARWAAANDRTVKAVTVDHGLRPESSGETTQVGRWLSARNIEHHILPWTGPKPKTGIQEAARNARYSLMADWMAKEGIADVALAHHAEDQAETFLLRAGQGSGIDGLASMSPVSWRHGVRILRPLLGFPKSRLRATLEGANQPWIEDPSNQNFKYTRVQLRALLPGLAERGADPVRVAALASRFGELGRQLQGIDRIAIAACATLHPEGFATLDAEYLSKLPLILRHRIIRQLIHSVGGIYYPPRRAAVDRLIAGLSTGAE
ncbi:MAG: tRNA lysidine(34) synthetase TilS, partial [Proteobacteria bacterium]|nr:tRNA lysidine(34) synthetase TilS [Pseudomonadota bacterium]